MRLIKNNKKRQIIAKGKIFFLMVLIFALITWSSSQFIRNSKADMTTVYWSETMASFVIPDNASLSVKNATVVMDIDVKNLTSTHYIYNVSLVANFTIRGIANRTNMTLGFVYPSLWNVYMNGTYTNITNIEIYANETSLNYTIVNGTEIKSNVTEIYSLREDLQVFIFNVTVPENTTVLVNVLCKFFTSCTQPEHLITYFVGTASTWEENVTEHIITRITHPKNMSIAFWPPIGISLVKNQTYLEYHWKLNKTIASVVQHVDVKFIQYSHVEHRYDPRENSPFYFIYTYNGPPNPVYNFILLLISKFGETGAMILLVTLGFYLALATNVIIKFIKKKA